MGYTVKCEGDKYSKAFAKGINCSWKDANQVCRNIKGMPLEKAYKFLNDVLSHKAIIRYYKYNTGIGHHNGVIGGYPEKAIKAVLKVLKSAEANAIAKGLNKSNLIVYHANAYKNKDIFRYRRARRVPANNPKGTKGIARQKLACIEIILKEM